MSEEHWSVTVERNGEKVVTIESNCLSGREISRDDENTIRTAASHLMAFIGHSDQQRPTIIGRVTGKLREGDQVPGMPNAICHGCGLGYRCMDADCPNDSQNPMWSLTNIAR